MLDIKVRIEELSMMMRVIQEEIETLREQCTHPEFVRGLTIVDCVQATDICTTCDWAKPIVFDDNDGRGYAVHST